MEELFSVMKAEEIVALKLRNLYHNNGFQPYHLSSFEEYDPQSQINNYLNEDSTITFIGGDGRIMALKPDITLSIVKNMPIDDDYKVYYNEDVYRHDRQNGEYERINQTGLEYIGQMSTSVEVEVLILALQSLAIAGRGAIDISHMGIVTEICSRFPQNKHFEVLKALQQKSPHIIQDIGRVEGIDDDYLSNIINLISLSGSFENVFKTAYELSCSLGIGSILDELKYLYDKLVEIGIPDTVELGLDFSLVNDVNYYNGLLIQGFLESANKAVLFGGRYDNLVGKQVKGSGGIGFGMYLNNLNLQDIHASNDDYLTYALPKGRMAEKVYDLLVAADLASPNLFEDNRKLIFIDEKRKQKFFLVKPSDVAIYVEHGVADIGVIGKDVLNETEPDILEVLDLQMGVCRLAVAAHKDFEQDLTRSLRVATKYPRSTRKYFGRLGQSVELISLHGSIELAPLLSLSDVIVDIVETGTTLKENDLVVLTDIAPSSARLIVNQATWRFKEKQIKNLLERLDKQI